MLVSPCMALTAQTALSAQETAFWNLALRAAEPGEYGTWSLADHDITNLQQACTDLADLRTLSKDDPAEENRDWVSAMVRQNAESLAGHLQETKDHLVRQCLPRGDQISIQFEPQGKGSHQFYARKLLDATCNRAETLGFVPTIRDLRIEDKLLVSARLTIRGRGAFRHFYQEAGLHRFEGHDPLNRRDSRFHTHHVAVSVSQSDGASASYELDPNEVTVSHFGSSGPGGQNVNKSQRGVRLIHEPTGLIESCMDQRSQLQNHKIAWARLSDKVETLRRNAARDQALREKRAQTAANQRALKRTRNYEVDQDIVRDERLPGRVFRWRDYLRGDWNDLNQSLWHLAILRFLGLESTSIRPTDAFSPDLVRFALDCLG